MTEEIIIDGIKVAGCKHYDLENNYCDQSYLGEGGLLKNTKNPKRCGCSPNCYYKQLKRLEQENKELKKFFDNAAKKNTSLENKIKEYHEQYDELYWTTDQLVKDKTRLKQTLEEMRILATKNVSIENFVKIQNKINEVLNDTKTN